MFIGKVKVYGIIYKIINLKNNKIYIGQSISGFNRRYKNDILKYSGNLHLKSSIEKYGLENFEIVKIFDIAFSKTELDIKECFWISYYKSNNSLFGYNKTTGGGSPTFTEEVRKKLSYKSRMRWEDVSYRNDLKNKLRLITKEESYRNNMSFSLKNSITHKEICSSELFRKKQSENKTKLWREDSFRRKMIDSINKSWNEERKIQHSQMMKSRYKDGEYTKRISQSFKNRWSDEQQREKLCNSMKKIYILKDLDTGICKEFLGREALAKEVGKSLSYVKKYMSKNLIHDGRYMFLKKH